MRYQKIEQNHATDNNKRQDNTNIMCTLEDCFTPYDRTRWAHYPDEDEPMPGMIYPSNIGNQMITKVQHEFVRNRHGRMMRKEVPRTAAENLRVKQYIRWGEECPICMDPITTKKNAYLTECGHAYHKTCMSHMMHHDYHTDNLNETRRCGLCAVCRQCIDSDCTDFWDYTGSYMWDKTGNGLDLLHHFEENAHVTNLELCDIGTDIHYRWLKQGCDGLCHRKKM
jgi:hypothetical protein